MSWLVKSQLRCKEEHSYFGRRLGEVLELGQVLGPVGEDAVIVLQHGLHHVVAGGLPVSVTSVSEPLTLRG